MLCRFFASFFKEVEDEAALKGGVDPALVVLRNDGVGANSPWGHGNYCVETGVITR